MVLPVGSAAFIGISQSRAPAANSGSLSPTSCRNTSSRLDKRIILRRPSYSFISGVSVFDVYEGKGIAPGKKSIAIAVTIQPREKTLTDEEIEALSGRIVAEVGKRTGGTLRG